MEKMSGRRVFHIHTTDHLLALEGVPLATFGQRLLRFVIDVFGALVLWAPLEFVWQLYLLHESHIDLKWDFHEAGNIAVMLLYWASCTYFGNGRKLGKLIARTRAMSLIHRRMGAWQSIERSLGMGQPFWRAAWE